MGFFSDIAKIFAPGFTGTSTTTQQTTQVGFLSSDVNEFFNKGFTQAGQDRIQKLTSPEEKTIAVTTQTDKKARAFGSTRSSFATSRFFNDSQVANINASQLDAFVSAFANRADDINRLRQAPGARSQTTAATRKPLASTRVKQPGQVQSNKLKEGAIDSTASILLGLK